MNISNLDGLENVFLKDLTDEELEKILLRDLNELADRMLVNIGFESAICG